MQSPYERLAVPLPCLSLSMAQTGRASRRAATWREELELGHEATHGAGELGWREATWASRLSFDKDKQLKVAMNGFGMTDEGAEEWGAWFLQYSVKLGHGALRASLVDFAENQLTSTGASTVLKTFAACGIPVHVLKLHHNIIKDGGGFADYLRTCEGCLQELHLSHNSLDAKASAVIVAAAASAKGKDGLPCYPRRSGARGFVPLWLRLEKNNIDDNEFSAIMDASMPDKLCSARSKWCTPHCCAAKVPPAVHAKNLGNQQRGQMDAETQDDSAPPGEFFLKLLTKSAQPADADLTKECTDADAGDLISGDGTLPEGWERAEIERWDPGLGRWVRGMIDIPPAEEPRSSLPKAQQEKLSMGLKALIGIGKCPDGNVDNGLEVTPAVSSKPGASLKTHRRGSQPSIGNVRQTQAPQPPNLMRLLREEGFQLGESQGPALNPEAPEFRPTPKARPAKGQAKAKDGRPRAARDAWNRYTLAGSSATSTEDALALPGSAMRLLAAGVRERPLPLKLPMPAEVQFGKDSLASSPQAEKEIAWNLRKDSFKEDDETQDASSGGGSGFFDEVSTADAVDTADSTEDTMGPETSKSEGRIHATV